MIATLLSKYAIVCLNICVPMISCVHQCACVRARVCVCVCVVCVVCVCVCVCMRVGIHVCMHVCMYMHVCVCVCLLCVHECMHTCTKPYWRMSSIFFLIMSFLTGFPFPWIPRDHLK